MPKYIVRFFNGEETEVSADTPEEAIDVVWHFTNAPVEAVDEAPAQKA